ncbi:L-glutamate gamma-semialdehyde dehydrogenase [Leptothoe spongobia]|uniref:L-glutamate gamma-semialdehyde dehydrogenase n=1 Tax=Leptothoe spongobia TAU-MAC 1115 TaxID=1967444 RepID=A0A947DHP2_9CYAN|nr:L-glutamate gamma-semialdehyde dehydrogenase [Leptothoe spongobia]MBT9316529.1 L-glutamate gamma-semialdehyde dehydrogenase [Leptothoe spongobia TAU-MAC 1115]
MVVQGASIRAINASTYETVTQSIAKDLLTQTKDHQGWLGQLHNRIHLHDQLLGFAMANPGLRVQLFRLIDCLPGLPNKTEIARHLRDYLGQDIVELPGPLKALLNFTNPDSVPGHLAATTFSAAVATLAKKYIAGETIDQVFKTLKHLKKQNLTFTLDLLGEAVVTETEAEDYLNRYLLLMEQLADRFPKKNEAELPNAQVSVKLTAFYSQFDSLDPLGTQAKVSERVRRLLRKAGKLGIAVHFDMEQYTYKDLTLAILKEVLMEPEFRQRSDIGITQQAYLRDSYQDLEDIIRWVTERGTPLTVRLVKGAYWDQEMIKAIQHGWAPPVYRHKVSTDANFERMTRLLLESHSVVYTAIGSHNVRSQAHAIAIADALQIPKHRIELQVLYGMADKLAVALANRGYRVRVYCPYGNLIPGMAYLIRRLLENTANTSFLRQSLEATPTEDLLAQPTFTDIDTQPAAPVLVQQFANTPNTDYAQQTARQTAQQAIIQVHSQLGQTYWSWVNGQYLQTETLVPSVNPSNPDEIIGHIGLLNSTQADTAVAAAKTAFSTWRHTPASERIACLRRAGELMAARRAELAAWIVLEVGKPLREADAEVSEAIDFCYYYADEMGRLDQENNDTDLPGETNRYRYFPRGIALVISPWNFPLAIATGMTVAALVTGNCTLLKPAENSAVVAAKLAETLIEAGFPAGVFQLLCAQGSTVGAHLVKHPDIHLIAFTGSRDVGCRIYADAAQLTSGQTHLKRVIAEMGGKNAIIIDASADLDQAVQGVVQSAFSYSGQKCSACSRVIVLEDIYETFVQRLTEATRSLNVGSADSPDTKVGPVIDATAQQRIQDFIEIGKREGDVALSMDPPSTGYFIGPTIFTHVSPDAQMAQQEIFGPVITVMTAKTFSEALTIANDTDYALTGGLYSRTPAHIEQAQTTFEVGNLYINRGITGAMVARQPFGGFKLSGVGSKAGGVDYLLQFMEPRVVTENIQRQGFAPIEGFD